MARGVVDAPVCEERMGTNSMGVVEGARTGVDPET